MPKSQKTRTRPNGSLRKNKKNYEKDEKRYMRAIFGLKNFILDAFDDLAVEFFTEVTSCRLCSRFLVMTARNSCCEPCLTEWINEVDDDDEIIVCRMCNRPIKTVLSGRELKIFCELVDLNEKKEENEHLGYPVLSNVAMDKLFENIQNRQELPDAQSVPSVRIDIARILN